MLFGNTLFFSGFGGYMLIADAVAAGTDTDHVDRGVVDKCCSCRSSTLLAIPMEQGIIC